MTGSRWWVVLAILCLAVLLVAIDATVLNLAIPAITTDLDASATQVLWILDIYSLVLAGLLVSAGALSDRLGRRRVLLAGCAIFGLASAAAAFAPSAEWLIAARVLMGIGGATIMPSTLAIIRSVFEVPRERTLAIGLWSAMAAAGAAVGPILGGVLLERFWWGSVFLINVPVLARAARRSARPAARAARHGRMDVGTGPPRRCLDGRPGRARPRDQGGLAEEGLTTTTATAGVTAALALLWFIRRQLRIAAPLLDVRMFRRRAFTGAVLGNLIALLALSGLLLFLSQHLQLVDDLSPLAAGVRLLPLTLGALVGAPLAAPLVRAPARHRSGGRPRARRVGMIAFSLTLDPPFAALAARHGRGRRRRRPGADGDQRRDRQCRPARQGRIGERDQRDRLRARHRPRHRHPRLRARRAVHRAGSPPACQASHSPRRSLPPRLRRRSRCHRRLRRSPRSHRPPLSLDSWRPLRYSRQASCAPRSKPAAPGCNRRSAAWLLVS